MFSIHDNAVLLRRQTGANFARSSVAGSWSCKCCSWCQSLGLLCQKSFDSFCQAGIPPPPRHVESLHAIFLGFFDDIPTIIKDVASPPPTKPGSSRSSPRSAGVKGNPNPLGTRARFFFTECLETYHDLCYSSTSDEELIFILGVWVGGGFFAPQHIKKKPWK